MFDGAKVVQVFDVCKYFTLNFVSRMLNFGNAFDADFLGIKFFTFADTTHKPCEIRLNIGGSPSYPYQGIIVIGIS